MLVIENGQGLSNSESYVDVDYVDEQFYVELSPRQRKAYNQLEKDMITWVEGNPLVVEFPITLRARLRQASLGMFSVDDAGEVTFANDCESSKIDYLVAVTSAIAEGVDGLQYGTRNILWLSRSDNRILNEQAKARILRHGQKSPVRSIEIIAVDTYDSGVLSSQVQDAIEMNKILREGK